MVNDYQKGVPGIPTAALEAVSDQAAKQVLRAVVDGWFVRNGQSGTGDNRFVTASEMGKLSGAVGGLSQRVSSLSKSPDTFLTPGQINRILNDLQAQIMNSLLWKELGTRIDAIDLSIVAEQNARIAAVQSLADNLATETATRLGFDAVQGSKIVSLESTTSTQATQISGLITRAGSSESSIISLNQTTAGQATALTALNTRVGTSETSITSLQATTASQASSLTSLSARTTTTEGGLVTAQSNISALLTVTATHTSQLTTLFTRVGNAEAEISQEQTTRASADNAIAQSVTTQFANVNSNVAGLQSQITTSANNVAALSSSITTMESLVGQNSAAIQLEATTRANVDGDLYSKYSVKIDQNGYVSGFGLMSTANNSTPFSQFIVRANSFAIGSPSGPGVAPAVPFIVQTTPQTMADGTVIDPGVYMDYAMVKQLDGAYINAGLLHAGTIYTGSKYIDLKSKQQILATASSQFFTVSYDPRVWIYANYIGTMSASLIFYGPDWHSQVPVNQRVRSCPIDSEPLRFLATCTCGPDERLSIWWRTGGLYSTSAWMNNGDWVSEYQASYGAAALITQAVLRLGDSEWIEFTAAPIGYVNGAWSIYNTGKALLQGSSMQIQVTNL